MRNSLHPHRYGYVDHAATEAERVARQPPRAHQNHCSKNQRSRARSGRLHGRVRPPVDVAQLATRMCRPHLHTTTPAQRASIRTTPSTEPGSPELAISTTGFRTTPGTTAPACRETR